MFASSKKSAAAASIVKATSETAVYNNFVRIQTKEDVFDKYDVLQNFGSGSMGSVYKVRLKPDALVPTKPKGIISSLRSSLSSSLTKRKEETEVRRPTRAAGDPHVYALKSILLDRISSEFLEELQNEIAILRSMDHPNIVKAYEVFYVFATKKHMGMIYLVLELCDGGDLYSRSPYTEKDAAKIVHKLLSAVRYMHDRGVVHRDLKYENILFENPSPAAEIKVIDFGLSKKFKSGTPGIMTERVGTIYTMSPQVLKGVYTSQSDLWALGVIAYMLLSSTKPFFSKKRRQMIELIMRGEAHYDTVAWGHISADAIDFVRQLLLKDPEQRLDAAAALQHRWIHEREQLPEELPAPELLEALDDSFLKYQRTSQLKKLALTVIAHRSTTKEICELRKAFDAFDTVKDGVLSPAEFKAALLSMNFPEHEISAVFASLDLNHNGKINYTEFLAATIEMYGHIEEDRISEAFDRMDTDDDGFISRKNLQEAMGKDYTPDKVEAILRASDKNKDGKISYSEFLEAFRGQTARSLMEIIDPDALGPDVTIS